METTNRKQNNFSSFSEFERFKMQLAFSKFFSCEGCKYNYYIDNYDMDTGQCLDSHRPNQCYYCFRNCPDNYIEA